MIADRRRAAWLAAGLVALLCLGFLLWQWRALSWSSWKYDEGLNVIKAQLVAEGYRLYRDIWSDQPPLFTLLLRGVFGLAGNSLAAGRLAVMLLSIAGLISAAWLAWRRLGAVAAVAVVALLAALPHWQELSRLMMIGLPAIALGLVALAVAECAGRARRTGWAAAAGCALALSWLVKPITVPWLAAAGVLLLWREGTSWRAPELWRRGAWYALGLAAPLALAALVYGPSAIGGQVMGTLVAARDFHGLVPVQNLRDIADYVLGDGRAAFQGLLLLASGGLVSLLTRRKRADALWMGVWLLAGLAAVSLHSPLRRHHLLLLMPPIAMLAGAGVHAWFSMFKNVQILTKREQMGLLGLTVALLLTVGQMPGWIAAGVAARAEVLVPNQEALDRRAAVEVLLARTAPGSLIVTDDPMLAFLAGRHVPPELAVVSARRVEAGALTSEGLIALCQERQPAAIVLFEQRLTRLVAFDAWVRGNWQAVAAFDDARWIYVPLADGRPYVAQPAKSAAGLSLVGVGYDTLAVTPGERLTLDVRLQAESAIEQDYTLFVHLVDEQGRAWGQHDVLPLDQRYPTSSWMPGESVSQRVVIPVAADAPPGEKLLAVGFYDATGRLSLVDGQGQPLSGGQVILSARPVVRWAAQTAPPTPQYRQEASLGGVARLVGYDLGRNAAERSLELTLYWLCQQGTPTSYTVFVHVLDASGAVVAQRDQRPGDGAFPTTGWAPGEYIADRYHLALPDTAGEGPFTLALGMYDLVTGQRLPVVADGAPLPDGLLRLAEPVTLR